MKKIIILFLLSFCVIGCSTDEKEEKIDYEISNISYKEVYDSVFDPDLTGIQQEKNWEKYEGKYVEWKGEIANMETINNEVVITIITDSFMADFDETVYFHAFGVSFSNDYENRLSVYGKNSPMKMTGRLSAYDDNHNLVMLEGVDFKRIYSTL